MAVQKYLEELSVQQLISNYNFIVPEIQREYVWGNNDYQILDKFFCDIKDAIKESTTNEEESTQIKGLEKMLERADDKDKESIIKLIDTYLSKKDLNIGFLYSYRPDYYVYNDRNDDVYLIDGQQRLTTLFLALFYFSLKENSNYEDFKYIFRFDEKLEKIGFDYRVRTLTHSFLIELIANSEKLEDLTDINQKKWFLTDFSNDVTVKAMIGTINKLHEHFKEDKTDYYQFVKKQIRFWHFKTEETSQGEELYITMNSRGQQLADNETVRAKLFENEKLKTQQIDWGAKWENWQDFFWKNKDDEGNADNGLNQFLRWVNIIEVFASKKFKTRDEAEKQYKLLISDNQVLEDVTLFEIEPYFNALNEIKRYFDEGFFDIDYFKNNFNKDWLKGDLDQKHLMKLLPALMFIKANKPKEHLNRFIRFFSNITNDSDIAKNPDTFIVECIQLTKLFLENSFNDIADIIIFNELFPRILTNEEVCKLSLFKNENDVIKRNNLEEAFWKAEDFKINKGKIGHLLQMSIYKNDDIESFSYVRLFDYNIINEIDLIKFQDVFSAYYELVIREKEIWGDLIDSEIYTEINDRVYLQGYWHTNNGLLKMCLYRKINSTVDLNDFIISIEKKFILKYKNESEILDETSAKKQLYIYYILHKRVLNKWIWSNWNFGLYKGSDYPKINSLFNNKSIYQLYNLQWRYNEGYKIGTGIWIQDNFDDNRNYISDLINWAKE